MRKAYIGVLCCVFAVATCSTAFAAIFYGGSASSPGDIYVIDTGAMTVTLLFSPTPAYSWLGATDSEVQNSIYLTRPQGVDGLSLYLADVVSFSVAAVGPYVNADIRELGYNEDTATLYGTDYNNLYMINKTTGLATSVGPHVASGDYWAMDYDGSIGQMVGVNATDDMTYYINMATGQATPVGPTGVDRISDIWYDHESGTMFGCQDVAGGDGIVILNTTTGAATLMFAGTGNLCGLGKPFAASPVENTSWGRVKSLYR